MAPNKKTKTKKKNPRIDDDNVTSTDIQYNPELVDGILLDIERGMESKCAQIKKDVEFMVASIQQANTLELIRLPNQVKTMTLSRFREEYGDSLEAVTRGQIGGQGAANKKPMITNLAGFQTPSSKFANLSTPARNPKEGEQICSKNGSPLGQFTTAVKAPKSTNSIIPQTPGVFVPLDTGDVIDLESVENLPEELKEDALKKMQQMVSSMQLLMAKIQK